MTKNLHIALGSALLLALGACGSETPAPTEQPATKDVNVAEDPYIWLEEVEGEKALNWVAEQNKLSLARLEGDARFQGFMDDALSVYNATDKIAYAGLDGDMVTNFWQDAKNVRGIWRKASYDSYIAGEPAWETVLDFDALAEAEGENWVYKGRDCLRGSNRCLIRLSRGGSDAVVVREFDKSTGKFVENGFFSPESKQSTAWLDEDTLLIGTNFGEGTMNASGYPSQVRLWKRGTELMDAEILITDPDVVFNIPIASHRKDGTYIGVVQGPDFFSERLHLLIDGKLQKLDLPEAISFQGFYRDDMMVKMRKDWVGDHGTIKAGHVAILPVEKALAGDFAVVNSFGPGKNETLEALTIGADRVLMTILTDVTGKIATYSGSAESVTMTEIDLPPNGSLSVVSSDDDLDRFFINYENFIQPSTLYVVDGDAAPKAIASLPERFDASDLKVSQIFATSKDGTRVPYFIVRRKEVVMDGSVPTLLYGYGGFEVSLDPGYLGGMSRLWIQEGGAYAIANIRGGGEYGPAWHQAALKENRQRAYDDFIAVAENIIGQGITLPENLGIRGGSNGGLLMGVMTTQRPDLFGAVICAVPLLDMYRYDKLLAGASWVGEYGDPDNPEEWAYISKYSPYQNVKADADYPEVFFFTSTKDDRVHPGHARKMAAKMLDQGHELLYYENTEGGHSAAANLKQRAYTDALQMVYLLQKLKD